MDEPAIIERLQAVRGELSEIKAANQVYWRSNVHSEVETELYERRRMRLEEIKEELRALSTSRLKRR
jgi:hypothetical protein